MLIVPIFIPHEGCPYRCVFCSQVDITGTQYSADEKNILDTLDAERQSLMLLDDSMSKQKKMRIERDIRYYASRIKTAILIHPDKQAENKVLFGALIELEDEKGETESYEIVGEDEADLALRKISYVSPLAKSVMGNSLGDEVTLIKPTATVTLTIKNITYNK